MTIQTRAALQREPVADEGVIEHGKLVRQRAAQHARVRWECAEVSPVVPVVCI